MTLQKRIPLLCGMLVILAAMITSGCQSSAPAPTSPSPIVGNAEEGKAKAIKQIQDNPNIPQQQKASIIAQIQSSGQPTKP
ncbi:hypothetical protein CCAX7_24880 [Capsulimonas corticalis]|uniref:Uncharacterized protein n=1 Tax=Capsulimonas corticalis TaxID=2219043 RepID=A0A402CVI4_9BACT|nr:hypothetical protein [Capsulimonas corticalis]BDI30437.1 hypothetical protein CCAX7_24880 [Capsulimonas corticalis]